MALGLDGTGPGFLVGEPGFHPPPCYLAKKLNVLDGDKAMGPEAEGCSSTFL